MEREKQCVTFPIGIFETLRLIPNRYAAQFMLSVYAYVQHGIDPAFTENEKMLADIWPGVKELLDSMEGLENG